MEKLLYTCFWKRLPTVFALNQYPAMAQITKKHFWNNKQILQKFKEIHLYPF